MIVADTGAIVALIDADDRHHDALLAIYEADPSEWILPWAVLPEIDYLLGAHVDGHLRVHGVQRAAASLYGAGRYLCRKRYHGKNVPGTGRVDRFFCKYTCFAQ